MEVVIATLNRELIRRLAMRRRMIREGQANMWDVYQICKDLECRGFGPRSKAELTKFLKPFPNWMLTVIREGYREYAEMKMKTRVCEDERRVG